jgi:uncharacterized protein YkwD
MKKLIIILFPFVAFTQIDNAVFQKEFTKVFNAYRLVNNKSQMKINTDANAAAKLQSDYLISTYKRDSTGKLKGILSHSQPDTNLCSPARRLQFINPKYNIDSTSIGENALVIIDYDVVSMDVFANKVLTIWKNSPGHNAALLDDWSKNEFGIYVSHSSYQEAYVEYEVDIATMSRKSVTKYRTIHYYTASIVFIGEIKWYY